MIGCGSRANTIGWDFIALLKRSHTPAGNVTPDLPATARLAPVLVLPRGGSRARVDMKKPLGLVRGAYARPDRGLLRRHQFTNALEEPGPARNPAHDLHRLPVRQLERRFEFGRDRFLVLARQEQVGDQPAL
jgi:hypothetical protein